MSQTNPADKVERWQIGKLVPYARNARTHSDEQIAQIAASIREWGWTTPVLVDEAGNIIAGHGRTLAAHKLGMTDIPVNAEYHNHINSRVNNGSQENKA